MKNIVWRRPDGSLAITHIDDKRHDLDSHAHELELQKRGDIPFDWVCVGHDVEVPEDRTFRNAWVWATGIEHDMDRCREIHRAFIRRKRKTLFVKYDGEWMRAFAKGDLVAAATAEAMRQQLRDAPAWPAIDSAKTPDELKLAIPRVLEDQL